MSPVLFPRNGEEYSEWERTTAIDPGHTEVISSFWDSGRGLWFREM